MRRTPHGLPTKPASALLREDVILAEDGPATVTATARLTLTGHLAADGAASPLSIDLVHLVLRDQSGATKVLTLAPGYLVAVPPATDLPEMPATCYVTPHEMPNQECSDGNVPFGFSPDE